MNQRKSVRYTGDIQLQKLFMSKVYVWVIVFVIACRVYSHLSQLRRIELHGAPLGHYHHTFTSSTMHGIE